MRPAFGAALVAFIGLAPGADSAPAPGADQGDVMATESAELTGRWTKATASMCADRYPDHLEFREPNLYAGRKQDGGFTVWDVGTWTVTDATHVAISTANDSVIRYHFTRTGDALTFLDDQGCEFSYRRAISSPPIS
jgi:hypothetical protein